MSANTEIGVKELLEKIDSGEPLMILDVRNTEEFENWRIEGRRKVEISHIPYFDFIEDEEAAIKRLPQSKREIVVVCAKGGSSEMVADILRGLGMPARNLVGGMIAYGEYLDPVKVPLQPDERHFALWQFNRRGKGCLSYAIISAGEAVIVDASRAIEVYESFLTRAAVRLLYALDTHIHADHVSGGPALATRLGASYLPGADSDLDVTHQASRMQDGAEIKCGDISIRVMATPGHTPGSVCCLIGDRYLLTGDTLFKTAVGRPDLGGHVIEWSAELFRTLRERIAPLPDSVVVLPAHYASVWEIGPKGVVSASLGELRRSLPELQVEDLTAFTEAMKRALGTPPPEYAEIINVNLGQTTADTDRVVEWELGKNQCAASTHPR